MTLVELRDVLVFPRDTRSGEISEVVSGSFGNEV